MSDVIQPLTVDEPSDAAFRETVRQFAAKTVAPRAREMDRAGIPVDAEDRAGETGR